MRRVIPIKGDANHAKILCKEFLSRKFVNFISWIGDQGELKAGHARGMIDKRSWGVAKVKAIISLRVSEVDDIKSIEVEIVCSEDPAAFFDFGCLFLIAAGFFLFIAAAIIGISGTSDRADFEAMFKVLGFLIWPFFIWYLIKANKSVDGKGRLKPEIFQDIHKYYGKVLDELESVLSSTNIQR